MRAIELAQSGLAAFDAYIMVDWSAASAPGTGKDSVWWCRSVWRRGRLGAEAIENPPTRHACFDVLRSQLHDLVTEGSSVPVGFDFPFGYSAGLARALGLGGAPWRAVWDEVGSRIVDDEAHNTNNRFPVANDLDQLIGAPEGPFWGHPQGREYTRLLTTEPTYPVARLGRLREADRYAGRVQPVWKLWGNGSVGGQALLGIPILARPRGDDELRSVSAIWPFETGCCLPREPGPRIVFAEIYPSLVPLPTVAASRVPCRSR